MNKLLLCALLAGLVAATHGAESTPPVSYSGIFPQLATFNEEGECGTGAIVPWAGRLWVISYAPHKPLGSTDKLYEITPDFQQIIRPESVGGTPANRMIHRESNQLFLGPYVIGADRTARVITPQQMYGRLTGNARHLTDPANKIYYATMEKGIYEVDVHSLAVTELWADEQLKPGRHSNVPGYHGKGLYSGQGRLIYANNGDHAKEALTDPTIPSGALAEWDGQAEKWTIIRRNQFTEVTGPGGIFGAEHPETDPVWTIGWDYRSLILMLLDHGQWQSFRLPKASHSYDGAHGWNTEWPRIREIGGGEFGMTMHGTFFRFPGTFSAANTAGIAARSNFLKITGDFCRWGDHLVFGCDDTAKSEFLNKRGVKGALKGPGQSQSNLWFTTPEQLDYLGPAIGTGAVWAHEAVKARTPSDPFLFSGYARRGLHLATGVVEPVTARLEVDAGHGEWRPLREVQVTGYAWVPFPADETGAWVRVSFDRDLASASAVFDFSNEDARGAATPPLFASLAAPTDQAYSGGVLLTRGGGLKTLGYAATVVKDGTPAGDAYYELDGSMQLRKSADASADAWVRQGAAIPAGVISTDAASVLVIDDAKRRWRLPKTDPIFDTEGAVPRRVCREVCTERDIFQAQGTFFELPAENAGGFRGIRPIATHGRQIVDYASYRGLLLLSGVRADASAAPDPHVIRSDDGQCALWAGAVDDLWQLGKPRGHGGPWLESEVAAGVPSDPYLVRGYDHKRLTLSHRAAAPVAMEIQIDLTGWGDWATYRTLTVAPGQTETHEFPPGFSAYWLRVRADTPCTATAQLTYD